MQINETIVTFDRLIRADRPLGTADAIAMPAEKAIAPNAAGVFAPKAITEIHSSAKATAAKLRQPLAAA